MSDRKLSEQMLEKWERDAVAALEARAEQAEAALADIERVCREHSLGVPEGIGVVGMVHAIRGDFSLRSQQLSNAAHEGLALRAERDEARAALGQAQSELATLKAELAVAVEALGKVISSGHNNDCLFCGFKDRVATDAASTDAAQRAMAEREEIRLQWQTKLDSQAKRIEELEAFVRGAAKTAERMRCVEAPDCECVWCGVLTVAKRLLGEGS